MVEGVLRVSAVHIAQVLGNGLVENDAAHGGGDDFLGLHAVNGLGDPQTDGGVQAHIALIIGHDSLIGVTVHEGGLIGAGSGALLLGL